MIVEIDDSRLPVVWAVFPEEMNDEELGEYLARSLSYAERKLPHILVVDLTHMGKSEERHRRIVAKWTTEHAALLREYRLGTVFVTPLAEQKRTLSGVFWHALPPYAYFLAFDAGAAWRWADKRLAELGLPPVSPGAIGEPAVPSREKSTAGRDDVGK